MLNLTELRERATVEREHFEAIVPIRFPSRNHWDWYRACAHMRGEDVRRNDDTSQDAAMARDEHIAVAHEKYIEALNRFYRARDGEHGFLGSI